MLKGSSYIVPFLPFLPQVVAGFQDEDRHEVMETDDDAYNGTDDDDDATVRKLSTRICQVFGASDKFLARHTAPAKAVSVIVTLE